MFIENKEKIKKKKQAASDTKSPTDEVGGDYRFALCPSVRPSVCQCKKSVFRTYDILYIALAYQDTDQVWIWFWSIDF